MSPPANGARESCPAQSVITIGTFDGVHVGHAALARAAREIADNFASRTHEQAHVVAMVFDPHPLTLLAPAAAPARIMGFDEKSARLRALGVDVVLRLEPRRELLDLSPEEFLERLVMPRRPLAIVEGNDFCFGKNRSGDATLLCSLGRRLGFETRVVEPVLVVFNDHSVVRASSTMCRWLLARGRVNDAAIMLGRPHTLSGTVVRGDRRGRTIGFPTANVETGDLLPADGVYAARAILPDGRTSPAAVNIGARPTFAGSTRTIEAHLIDAPSGTTDADGHVSGGLGGERPRAWVPLAGVPEYGWKLSLELIAHVRDQVRFPGIEALRGQLTRDIERVRRVAGARVDTLAASVAARG